MLGPKLRTALVFGFALTALAGCTTQRPVKSAAARPLRVGVTPNSPPFVFRQAGELAGLEVDFARELTSTLGRSLELREVQWDELIPTLEAGRIDLIMSGMTITRARQVRIAFSEPYLLSGLIAVVRREDTARYPDGKSVLQTRGSIGAVENTTGERFVRERAPRVSVSVYPSISAAVRELGQRRVDAVVHDAPVLLSFVSANEAELAPVLHALDQEPLGWGIRRDDAELRTAVNGILARWRADGTRERILSRWVPYWSRLEAEAAAQRP